jgi:hypothetical protein
MLVRIVAMLTKLLMRFDPELYRVHESAAGLVYRLLNPLAFVAFEMGPLQGGPSRTGRRGRISKAIRNRRATQPPAHFNATLWAAAGWLFFRPAAAGLAPYVSI